MPIPQGPETEGIGPSVPEKSEIVHDELTAPEKGNRSETLHKFITTLDQSDIGPELKEIADSYLQRTLKGEAAVAYLDTVRANGQSMSLSRLLETAGEQYLAQRPDVAEQFKRREITAPALFDKILDRAFDTTLENTTDAQERLRVQNLIRRYKSLAIYH